MQDSAIAAIGRLELKRTQNLKSWEFFVENMFPGKNYKMVLIVFEFINVNGIKIEYKKIDVDDVSEESDWRKYAYRKGYGSGGDITFTTKIGDKKLNTIKDKQFKKLLVELKGTAFQDEFSLFKETFEALKNDFDKINNEIKEVYNQLDKEIKNYTGISIVFLEDNKYKYLGEFKVIQSIINKSGTEGKTKRADGTESIGYEQLCSVMKKKQSKIFGFASPFKYSSIDKPGMVSGFFKQKNNWKNYPISEQAALELEYGKIFINKNLHSFFYGNSYFFIPRTVINQDENTLNKILTILTRYTYEMKDKKIKSSEEYIEKMIAKEDDYFSLDLMFFEEDPKTKAIKIKLMVEEVFPSRFRFLFVEIPNKLNKKEFLKLKEGDEEITFNYGLIKELFRKPGVKREYYIDEFLATMNKIYMGLPITEKYLYEKIMLQLKNIYNKSQNIYFLQDLVIKSIMIINFFHELGNIKYNKDFKLMEETIPQKEKKESFDLLKYQNFIKQNSNLFDSNEKIGVFSVGVLVRLLFSIQFVHLGSTPFEKKLHGFNLNPEKLKYIYIETLGKIQQYDGFYAYGNLRDFINDYFILNSNSLITMSNNEISFYFVAGLELGNRFKTIKENTNNQIIDDYQQNQSE